MWSSRRSRARRCPLRARGTRNRPRGRVLAEARLSASAYPFSPFLIARACRPAETMTVAVVRPGWLAVGQKRCRLQNRFRAVLSSSVRLTAFYLLGLALTLNVRLRACPTRSLSCPQHPQLLVRPVDPVGPVGNARGVSSGRRLGCAFVMCRATGWLRQSKTDRIDMT